MDAEGRLECGALREILKRPHHSRICGRHLAGQAMSSAVNTASIPKISLLAGQPAPKEMLIDLAELERDYFERRPDVNDPNQMVSFGTSGHRGSALDGTFTEAHILAITQAICDYRRANGPDGPLYLGK